MDDMDTDDRMLNAFYESWLKDNEKRCKSVLHGKGADPTDYGCDYDDGHEGDHAELDDDGTIIYSWTTHRALRSKTRLL